MRHVDEGVHLSYEGSAEAYEKYYPLGKLLVRQMKAGAADRGMEHFHKKYSFEDGSVIVICGVRTGHMYVRVVSEPIDCAPRMETSATDLINLGLLNPLMYEPGKVNIPPPLKPGLNWRVSADPGALVSDFDEDADDSPLNTGDTSRAFGYDVEDYKDDPDDPDSMKEQLENVKEQLWMKKFTAARAPASCYTGKARLFVQAIYGMPLTAKSPDIQLDMTPLSRPPVLYFDYPIPDDVADEVINNRLVFSTNAGIYRTPKGNYWYIHMESEPRVVRLNHNTCSRALSDYLMTAEGKALTPEQQDIIEAFIFTQLTASATIRFKISGPITSSTYAMGYGYHFNWDGDKANIVNVGVIWISGVTYKYRSQHYEAKFLYREEIEFDDNLPEIDQEKQRWSMTNTMLEQSEWKVGKWQSVIASPDWTEYKLEIFGALWGNHFGTNAPIYCFYQRNDLQVLRVTVTGGNSVGVQYMCESTPTYYMAGNWSGQWLTQDLRPCSQVTRGLEPGFQRNGSRTTMPSTYVFSIAGASITSVSSHQSMNTFGIKDKHDSGEVAFPGYYGWDVFQHANTCQNYAAGVAADNPYTSNGCMNPGAYDYWYGATPTIGGGGGYATEWVQFCTGPATVDLYDRGTNTWTWIQHSGTDTDSKSYKQLIVIPFYDAEAVYLGSSNTETTSSTSNETSYKGGSTWQYLWKVRANEGLISQYLYHDDGPGYGMITLGTRAVSNTESTTMDTRLFANSQQVHTVSFPMISAFFAGEPTTHVEQTFSTITSAVFKDSLAHTFNIDNSGYGSFPSPMVFTGGA